MKNVVVYPRMDYHLGAINGATVGDFYSLQPYYTGWSFNLVPSLYGMAVLLHAKVTTLQFIFKNGHNLGSDYHFLMKLSGFLNYG